MLFRKKLERLYVLTDYQKWKGRWVHWSDTPYLKINPKGFHMDPAGLYFFPESFKSEGSWHRKRYKFLVEVPADLKVLDLAQLNTPEASLRLLDTLKVTDGKEYSNFRQQIESGKRPIDTAWEYLQRYFGAATGAKRSGAFNKCLREAGYEAVFDDTGAIHTSEVQLLVLDPRKLKIIGRQEQKGSGFNIVKEIFDFVQEEGTKYGNVSVSSAPMKKWEGWSKENQITSSLKVWTGAEILSEKYVYIDIAASPNIQESGRKFKDMKELMKANVPVSQIIVRAGYSKPSLEGAPWSLKKYYKEDMRDVRMDDIKEMVRKLLHYVFLESKEKT